MLESAPESERAMDIILDLPSEELPKERVLGIQWSVGLACFGFSIVLKDQPLNRRGVPVSVYDPLGFLAPLVLRAKKILQEICRRGVSWDEPLPEDVWGQGGSGGNVICCASRSYKFQDSSSRRRWAKRRAMRYTTSLTQARPDTDNAPTLEWSMKTETWLSH